MVGNDHWKTKRVQLMVNLQCCVFAKSLQSYMTLRDPIDHSPPGSSVHGILQAKILERVAMPSSRGLPDPGIEHMSLWLLHCRQILYC